MEWGSFLLGCIAGGICFGFIGCLVGSLGYHKYSFDSATNFITDKLMKDVFDGLDSGQRYVFMLEKQQSDGDDKNSCAIEEDPDPVLYQRYRDN